MLKKLLLYYHTLRYLKWVQIRYRVYYLLRNKWRKRIGYQYDFQNPSAPESQNLRFDFPFHLATRYQPSLRFTFLAQSHTFAPQIDWNYSGFGKLWTYNLNYFEFLQQESMSVKEGRELINDFISKQDQALDGMEPFPISLRVISWIKFLVQHQVKDLKIDQSLYAQLNILLDNLEYHILGNHLLENSFALLFGAYYFKEETFFVAAKNILQPQLEEQILEDGGHFELSPMYHQQMLFRVLDSINLVRQNDHLPKSLLPQLEQKAAKMLFWLRKMTFSNGDIPLVNDSAFQIAPSSANLFQYAKDLQITPDQISLKQSGYRSIKHSAYECVIDIGNIGPDYLPGHAHNDMLSLVIYTNEEPFLVDTGTSTYNTNKRRQYERSTQAHNTVQAGNWEQSEVWGGFRVGKRAHVSVLCDKQEEVEAQHTGFVSTSVFHRRKFKFYQKSITLLDSCNAKGLSKAFFHFHPAQCPEISQMRITSKSGSIVFEQAEKIILEDYQYASGFNHMQVSKRAIVFFNERLVSRIEF